MDEESCTKTCIKEKGTMGGIHQPFYGTWVADFMHRQNAEKFMLEKYLNDQKNDIFADGTNQVCFSFRAHNQRQRFYPRRHSFSISREETRRISKKHMITDPGDSCQKNI